MTERPRRRRADDEPSGGSGLPLFPLVLVVILAGLLLGGVLAHFCGGGTGSPRNAPSVVALAQPPVTPLPSTGPSPSPEPTPQNKPTPRPSASAASTPTPTPTPTPKPVATPTPASKPSSTPAPPVPTPAPAATPKLVAPTPPPVPVSAEDAATSVVRSYLSALAHGDRDTAASYLAQGSPDEPFLNGGASIVSVHSSQSGSQYRVTAEVKTSVGEYYGNFVLAPGPHGLQITDHYWTKPQ